MSGSISASGLNVSLAGKSILRNIEVSFSPGRWTAVVGVNGCGKSTLLRTLAGLLPYEGELRLNQQNLRQIPTHDRARRIAWLGQSEAVSDELTVRDVAMLGRLPHQGLLASAMPADQQAVSAALAQVDLTGLRERRMAALSAGERQRALLARALATQAQVLLLDEPLAALDIPHQVQWAKLMQQLRSQGTTVVSVLHELHIALLADELVLMHQGRVVAQGSTQDEGVLARLEQLFEHSINLRHEPGVVRLALRQQLTDPS